MSAIASYGGFTITDTPNGSGFCTSGGYYPAASMMREEAPRPLYSTEPAAAPAWAANATSAATMPRLLSNPPVVTSEMKLEHVLPPGPSTLAPYGNGQAGQANPQFQ
ncbi:hypothetical protein PHYPSEUDO_006773 [Phytophthora pseudosyringae]|uniref:Uncharacterized protein n=1 Tax=Phytophthora pseudosyringae TaxID=221518 RepID=A0A8T1VHT4_9STRA|nr:hypothetical protein PHYPSEUDO_006773 [Phytophthora pseudosyringae]